PFARMLWLRLLEPSEIDALSANRFYDTAALRLGLRAPTNRVRASCRPSAYGGCASTTPAVMGFMIEAIRKIV
ncbi:MAG: hypothetical protein ACXVAK_09420, partial [Vulcanimicrobiaceae bacterium]